MKISIYFTCAFTMIILLILKDLYLSWYETVVVILGSSFVGLISRYILNKKESRNIHIISALIAFIFYWIFSYSDIVGDHYLYYLPSGNEDGRPLTIGEKISEFNDDLLAVSYIAPIIVLAISILLDAFSKLVKGQRE